MLAKTKIVVVYVGDKIIRDVSLGLYNIYIYIKLSLRGDNNSNLLKMVREMSHLDLYTRNVAFGPHYFTLHAVEERRPTLSWNLV